MHKCVANLFIFSQWTWCAWELAGSNIIEGWLLCYRNDIFALIIVEQGDHFYYYKGMSCQIAQ